MNEHVSKHTEIYYTKVLLVTNVWYVAYKSACESVSHTITIRKGHKAMHEKNEQNTSILTVPPGLKWEIYRLVVYEKLKIYSHTKKKRTDVGQTNYCNRIGFNYTGYFAFLFDPFFRDPR